MDPDTSFKTTLMHYARHWYWFVGSLVLLLLAAFGYLSLKTPVYLSQSRLLIKDEKKGIESESILKDLEMFSPKQVVENEIEILRSYAVLNDVADQLNLDVVYFHITPFGKREVFQQAPLRLVVEKPSATVYEAPFDVTFIDSRTISLNGQAYPLNTSVQTPQGRVRFFTRQAVSASTGPLQIRVTPRDETIAQYLRVLTAEPTSKASTVIQLSIETGVPDKGEAILNRLVDVYIKASVQDKNRVAANTLNFIDERLQLVSGELQSVEKGVENYKATQGITDLGMQAQGFLETAQQNDASLNQINIQLQSLNDIQKYVYSQPQYRSGTPATLGLNDPTLLSLLETFTRLETQREQLLRTTSEQNPLLQTINSQLKSIKANISGNIITMRNSLVGAKQQVTATNRKIEGEIRTIPAKERILMSITRQQSIKNDLYTYLLRKREETAVSYASAISDSRVIDAARTDSKPIKPKPPITYALFGLAGLLLPAGFLAVRQSMNDRVMRRADVEAGTQAPILGELIKKKQPGTVVVTNQSNSVIAEQIRTLRTNLNYLRSQPTGSQVLLFTSSIEGEGKSFISINLGASLALLGMRTVILEMDLRKPKLRKSLQLADGPGLSDYLTGNATLPQIVRPLPGHEPYFIITSGLLPPNPSELLSTPRMDQLFADLRKHFDYILVDSPPVGLVTDAQLIAPQADTTLYIVRHDVTPKNSLKLVESLYQEKRFNNLNIVLNAIQNDASSYYSHGGYGNRLHQVPRSRKKTVVDRINPNA